MVQYSMLDMSASGIFGKVISQYVDISTRATLSGGGFVFCRASARGGTVTVLIVAVGLGFSSFV